MKHFLFTLAILITVGATAQPYGRYLSLDGVDDYTDVSTIAGVIPDETDFTVEGWVRACGLTGYVFDSREGTTGPGVELEITALDEMTLRMQGTGGLTDTTFEVVFLGHAWNHFALTHETLSGDNVFYINGKPVLYFYQDFTTHTKFFIGQSDSAATGHFDGWVEEYRVSDTIRYNGYFNPSGPFTADVNTRALWHFDEMPGAAFYVDESAYANDLTPRMGADVQDPFTVMPVSASCPGTTISLEAVGGVSYSWVPSELLDDPFIATPVSTPETSTYFGVQIDDDNSCSHTEWVYAELFETEFEATVADPLICVGETTQLFAEGGVIFWWEPIGSDLQSPFVSPEVATTYTVHITDVNGCEGDAEQIVGVENCATGWDEELDMFDFTAGPNPGYGPLQVQLTLLKTASVQLFVYDMTGRVVRSWDRGTLTPGYHDINLQTELGSGRYILVANTDEGKQVLNFTVID